MKNKLHLSLILAACSFNAFATSSAGNIDDFDGEFTDYTIQRGTETIPMQVYASLYPGDRIEISGNHYVDIIQCGEIHKITHKDSPYQVVQSKECKVIGLTDNIWLALENFAQYVLTIAPNPPVGVHLPKSEEEPLAMPILDRTFRVIPSIKAGERALALQWSGGKSPYQVQITTAEKEVLWQTEAKVPSVKTEKIHFKAEHTYWIIITAANSAKYPLEREFEAVAKLPNYPAQLQDNALPENMRRTLQAAWLAEPNRVKWSFEAYQQVFDIADNYGPARELREALAY